MGRPFIGIRADGSKKAGMCMGHLYTCAMIADFFKHSCAHPVFFSKSYEDATSFFNNRNHHVVLFDENISLENEHKLMKRELVNYKMRDLIIDLPKKPKAYSKLDVRKHYVDHSPDKPNDRIIHPLYSAIHTSERWFDDKNALICMGGHDLNNITLPAAKQARKAGYNVTVVLGSSADFDRKQNILNEIPDATVLYDIETLAVLMSEADLGIFAGGNLMYEAMCTGLPSIIISQIKHQEVAAEIMQKQHAVFSYGKWDKDEYRLLQLIHYIRHNRGLQEQLCVSGKNVIDGKGIFRFHKKIMRVETI